MLNLDPVKKKYGDYICRRCLNEQYHVNLQPRDCNRYFFGRCRCCKEDRRLIRSLKNTGKLKMFLK